MQTSTFARKKVIKKREALAFCWQNKKGLWWCDGPNQILWSPESSLKKAVKSVGCTEYKKTAMWAGNNKIGKIFFCGRSLSAYDRDIRTKYGISKF